MNQTIDKGTSGTAWSRKALLGACLMVVAALLAACLIAAQPAHAATTFTVNFNGDFEDIKVGDGICDASTSSSEVYTLRAAIQESNATTDADSNNFNIPEAFRNPDTGVATIKLTTPLPPITHQATINGYTQPLAHPNTLAVGNDASLKIELTQTGFTSDRRRLDISFSSGSVIKGLVINRFPGSGISVVGDSAIGNRIEGNFIGTNPTGTLDEGNGGDGVFLTEGPSENVVGGTTPAARNLISGNGGFGVSIRSDSEGNLIKGNYIGTDKSGTKDLGNDKDGVMVNSSAGNITPPTGNTVGGTTATSRNVISGNHGEGIEVSNSLKVRVLGNRVGTTADGKGALGNDEDGVTGSVFALLIGNGTAGGSNTIAFNGDDGVDVIGISALGIEISHNSVFSNAGLGIDLADDGPTKNDPGDADTGSKNLQNKPVLSSAKTVYGTTTITGKLESIPGKTYTVEFYSNPKDTTEGKKFIGEKSVTTSVDGLRSFTFIPPTSVAAGQSITAAATKISAENAAFIGNDTSEFSAPKTVASS